MNRPQVPGQALGQSPDQTLQRMMQQENRLTAGMDASRYVGQAALQDAGREGAMAQNTATHRFSTELHQQAADQVTMAGPSEDARILQALSGFKRAAMANLGTGSAANQLAELGAMAAGGIKAA